MFRLITKTLLSATFAASAVLTAASAETVVIGHFGSPTPMQYAVAEKKFEEATGWKIEWRKFGAGTDVIAAMASGDIKLAELGSSPLATAASQGVDLQLFMLAQILGEAESLIVSNDSGIKKIEDLAGKRIAVPIGSTAHFSLMGAISKAGLKESDLTIMNMSPDQIAAAWQQGAIDGAFVWQPVQSQILKNGFRLVGADKTAEWGFPTYDGWVVDREFAAENSEKMVAFAKAMNEANLAYLNNQSSWTKDSKAVKAIASVTGADPSQIPEILKGFAFIPLSEQVKPIWLGNAADVMKTTAEFLQAAGRIDNVKSDYSVYVNLDIPERAAGK